jgi:hypothetical protein
MLFEFTPFCNGRVGERWSNNNNLEEETTLKREVVVTNHGTEKKEYPIISLNKIRSKSTKEAIIANEISNSFFFFFDDEIS